MARLTDEQRHAVVETVHGSPEARELYSAAVQACLAYARASGCPLGNDAVRWVSDQTRLADAALRTAVHAQLAAESREKAGR